MKIALPKNINSNPDFREIFKKQYGLITVFDIFNNLKPPNGIYTNQKFGVFNTSSFSSYDLQGCGWFTYYTSLVLDCNLTMTYTTILPRQMIVAQGNNFFGVTTYSILDRKIISPPSGKMLIAARS